MASEKNKNTNTKEMKILIPTTKIQESVKCENTAQACEIFRKILDFDTSVHWKWQLNLETQSIFG